MSETRLPTGRLRAPLLYVTAVASILLAFPPFSLWPLALVAAWPATAFVLEAPTPRAAALRGWLYGVAVVGLGTGWLAETLWLNAVLVGLAGAMWHAAWGWACRRTLPTARAPFALPLLWTAMEMARLNWPLSGYPWVFLGHALAASPLLVQAADLGGVLLLSFLAACVADGLRGLRERQRPAALVAATLLVAAAIYGVVRPAMLPPPRPGPRVATIQPAFTQQLKDNPMSSSERYTRCIQLSREALTASPPPDVLAWPETMWPLPMGEGADTDVWYPAEGDRPAFGPRDAEKLTDKTLRPLFETGRTELVLGTAWRSVVDGRPRMSNRAVIFDATGRRVADYDKVILVPGGESIPFGSLLPAAVKSAVEGWITSAAGFVADLLPGTGHAPRIVGGVSCGVTICFENAYGRPSRESVGAGAAFLLNLSNEAWFGTSTEHDHMELHSVLRAVETRRALFRATNSGISCLVRPDGRRPSGADRFTVGGKDRAVAGVFAAQVPLHDGLTPYVRWGDWIGWVGLSGTVLLLVLHGRKRIP